MKKKYIEPELDRIWITATLMTNIDLSKPEVGNDIGNDDNENENIGGETP